MANTETIDRILDAAELLFAEKGFSETSLRMITSEAGVNLAAVNYHFGSKNALIQAVFSRFLTPLIEKMEAGIAEMRSNQREPEIRDVFELYLHSLLNLPTRNPSGITIFMRLMGLAYTQSQGHLRKYLEQEYNRIFRYFLDFVKRSTPNLSTEERFWRLQFSLGAMAFTMSSIQPLTEIIENKQGAEADPRRVVDLIVPFLDSGFNAQT